MARNPGDPYTMCHPFVLVLGRELENAREDLVKKRRETLRKSCLETACPRRRL